MNNRLGDTSEGTWLMQMFENCYKDIGGNRSAIDMNLLIHMCKEEPKNAQVSMQLLAQELKKNLNDRPVSEAKGMAMTHRLVLGSIFIAYGIARHLESGTPIDEVPSELSQILRWHPIIIECANWVSEQNSQLG